MLTENTTPVTDEARTVRLTELYQAAFPSVARYIHKMGGTEDEAKDIFHDALLIYMEKEYSGGINLQHSEKSYLLGIAKNLWHKRFNEISRLYSGDAMAGPPDDDEPVPADTAAQKLAMLLKTSGQKCLELLSAFYYENLSMEKLAERFGFSGARSATAQKFKCLEKVKETVKTKLLHYEDFTI